MTVRSLMEVVYPRCNSSDYATVQKLLERLGRKKLVKCDRRHCPHQFEATIDREEIIGRRLQATADKLCEGSLAPLVCQLVNANLSRTQLTSLRELVNQVEQEKGRSLEKPR